MNLNLSSECSNTVNILNNITTFTLYGANFTLNISLSECTKIYPYTISWDTNLTFTFINNKFTVDYENLKSGPYIYQIGVLLKISGIIVNSDWIYVKFIGVI